MYTAALDQTASFQVSKGMIDYNVLGKTGVEDSIVEIGILAVWADVAKYDEMVKPAERKLWLVTENAIPARSLVPEIRVGEKN